MILQKPFRSRGCLRPGDEVRSQMPEAKLFPLRSLDSQYRS